MPSVNLSNLASGEVAQAYVDHMGGPAYFKEYVEADTSWLSLLAQYTSHLENNVAYYVNAGVFGTEASRKRKLISAEGFPASIEVNYSFMTPSGYVPWSSTEDREIKQVVLHSFGQQWHAFKSDGKWFGVMNQANLVAPYQFGTDLTRSFRIPAGTNVARGMEHTGRLAGALSACMFPTPGNAGTHFVISRSGDLYVLADCNDSMNSCHDLSPTAISIALEEALYLEYAAGDPRPVATWLPTGTPSGTGGTLTAWDFSEQQYLTLAILIKKLKTAYPSVDVRTHTSAPGEASTSFTGYTMHGHIQGADARYVDVAPHFQTEDEWTALFDLVDTQSQVLSTGVWITQDTGYTNRLSWAENLVSTLQSLAPGGLSKKVMTSPALASLLGILRAHREFQNTNRTYRAKAAVAEAQNSVGVKKQAGMEVVQSQAAKTTPCVPAGYAKGTSECVWDI